MFHKRAMLAGGGDDYSARVLATSPLALWPERETSGTTIICANNPLANGAYNGTTLAQLLTPFGTRAPQSDGISNYDELFSPALASVFNPLAGSFLIWINLAASVWTSGTSPWIFTPTAGGLNRIEIYKGNVNDSVGIDYYAGGFNGFTTLNLNNPRDKWAGVIFTWDRAAGNLLIYAKTVGQPFQTSSPGAITADMTGALIRARSMANDALTVFLAGYSCYKAIWPRRLTPAEAQTLLTP